ncbi:type II toxin-antitoxin system RnlB family antitoxin [Pseudanabaenaceae cyanobacterium LEGE 13415]|nr:type II toxin-antitoxin system RnlB family antitoxin [Pseudanabaenaceae cyanobacterium LEGE 13415]
MPTNMNTKELYQIERIADETAVVFGTTYINPISYLPAIEEDLGKLGFSGQIVFDLLLSNGFRPNRFVEADVIEAKISRPSMRVVEISSLDETVIEKTYEFYKSHPNLVESNNILMEEEKYYLIHD